MILRSVLQARANRGYRWLQAYGPRFDLDVNRLHERGTVLNAQSGYTCPLALCNTSDHRLASPYAHVLARLRLSQGLSGRNGDSSRKLDTFLTGHGFNIWPSYTALLLFRAGSQNDWNNLTQAWRKVIAANPVRVSATDD